MLSKILENKNQIRKAPVSEQDYKSLEASLIAHGLLQSVVVAEDPKKPEEYVIIAGNRRLEVLKKLAKEGKTEADPEIPCLVLEVRSDSTQALEASIAENDIRAPANPVDRQEAYLALNLSVPEISQRFGVPERQVKADLAIAGVHEEIKETARMGELPITSLRIYALSQDQKRQKEVFDRLGNQGPVENIRESLLGKGEYAGGSLGRFCNLQEYERRGGRVIEDMLSRDGSGNILPHAELIDTHILHDLSRERLEQESNEARDEGWHSVEYFESERQARLVLLNHHKIAPEDGENYTTKEKSKLSVLLFCNDGKTEVIQGVDLQDRQSYEQTLETANAVQSDCNFQESEILHGVEAGVAQSVDVRDTMQGHFSRTRARILRESIEALDTDESYPLISAWIAAESETHLLFPECKCLFLHHGEKAHAEPLYSGDPIDFLLHKAKKYHSVLKGRKTWKADSKVQHAVLQKFQAITDLDFARAAGSFFGFSWNQWHADYEYFSSWKRTELSWLALEVADNEAAEYIISRPTRDEAARILSDYANSDKEAIAKWKSSSNAPDSLKVFAKWEAIGISMEKRPVSEDEENESQPSMTSRDNHNHV